MAELKGVIAAAATPLRPDFSIDHDKLVAHCRWLLDAGGCNGVNLLGTTGEATSFSVEQRLAAMKAIATSGLPLRQIMVGTGAAALSDTLALTAAARDLGFAGALLLPPFYYKGIDPRALADFVATVVRRLGGASLRLYLYHIPQNTGVPYPIEVVERLHAEHPEVVIGLKDSAGDLAFSRELARRLPGFHVFPGSEASLAESRKSGFAGCISATTNITGALAQIGWRDPDSESGRQAIADAAAVRDVLAKLPLVCSVKAALADLRGDPAWTLTSPPLRSLDEAERSMLLADLATTAYRRFAAPVTKR
jgi:4-hydroxy-tetrahydrodipicolinate synthase